MPEVLLIGLGDEVLGASTEDARIRHIRYAENVNHLHMLAWSQRTSVPVSLSPKLTVYPVGKGGRLQFMRDALRVGKELIRTRSIKVISTQEPFYTAAVGLQLRRAGVKLQIQNHSDFFDNPAWINERRLWNGLLNAFGKWAVRRADRLRVVNTTEKQKYVAMGIAPENVDVLPVTVDLSAFSRIVDDKHIVMLRQRWEIAENAPALFWVGRPVPFKDLGVLLHAVSLLRVRYPNVVLILGGDFSHTPQWPELAHTLNLERAVRFVGPIGRDELPDYFDLCDVYVHASMYEGFGRVMLEASAAAKPVAATRTSGALDIVRDGETGLLCEPRSPEALAHILGQLLADPIRAQQMGLAARGWVQAQFEAERLTRGVTDAWKKMAA
jgi:glycosyltransferase involved in cell wall biosynthesis